MPLSLAHTYVPIADNLAPRVNMVAGLCRYRVKLAAAPPLKHPAPLIPKDYLYS